MELYSLQHYLVPDSHFQSMSRKVNYKASSWHNIDAFLKDQVTDKKNKVYLAGPNSSNIEGQVVSCLIETPNKYIIYRNSDSQVLYVVKKEDHKMFTATFDNRMFKQVTVAIEPDGVIHMDDGTRWEGEHSEELPCGWGKYYDKDGKLVYEGYRIDECRMFYGIEYDPNTGEKVYEGNWYWDERIGSEVYYYDSGTESVDSANSADNRTVLSLTVTKDDNLDNLSSYRALTILEIGDEWDSHFSSIRLDYLKQLRCLTIGYHCSPTTYDTVCIQELLLLETLTIGESSFINSMLSLKYLPSLTQLRIGGMEGNGNFVNCDLDLTGIFNILQSFIDFKNLTNVYLGRNSFKKCSSVVFCGRR